MTSARRPAPALTVVAVVVLILGPLLPGAIADGSAAGLVRLPWESVVAVPLLALLPRRPVRVVVAAVFGLGVVLAVLLAGLDAAFESTLDIHFDPLEWQRLGEAFGVVVDSVGEVAAIAGIVLLLAVAAALAVVLAWAALRVAAAARRDRGLTATVGSALAGAWIVAAVLGAQLLAGQPFAAATSVAAIDSAAARAAAGIAAVQALPARIASDPYRDASPSDLLTALRGKDVIFAFVESYGQVAVQGSSFSGGVDDALRRGDAQLTADGYASESAFLTSPTFGGISWLAHSTLQTGLWIDQQSVYDAVVASDRFTLSDAFHTAGWRTVSDVPSDTDPWPVGSAFYHFDELLNAGNVGYEGPSFGYARIPDEYTWRWFADHELAGPHQPVMAELDLVSSHTPWAPLPQLVPWSQAGDSAVYAPQPAEGRSASEVWQAPASVQQAYAQSIEYSLGAMFAFLHASDDPDLVVVMLGDHQPATIVSGQGASHDVPISIIAKDPAVLGSIADWGWQDGMLPGADAPTWPMSDFRDRFLEAFGAG